MNSKEMDCPICFDKFTKQIHRKAVECPHCSQKACVRCTETHITTSQEDPHCFNCRHGWSYEFLQANFPKTWYQKDFKTSRENLLLDRERSRLPLAQAWAERMKQATTVFEPIVKESRQEWKNVIAEIKIINDIVNANDQEHMQKYRKEYMDYYRVDRLAEDKLSMQIKHAIHPISKELHEKNKRNRDRIKELNAVKRESFIRYQTYSEMRDLYMNSTDKEWAEKQERIRIEVELRENNETGIDDPEIRNAMIASIMETVKRPGEKTKLFTMKCPGVECRGFLSTHYKCGICERSSCTHCLNQYSETDPDGSTHTCKAEDKESVALIKNTCRNCPSCSMSIFKTEGCNQMFCTACNTAFDWATGRELVTKQIHNPHYMEYLNRIGHSQEDTIVHANCQNELTPRILQETYINPYKLMVICHFSDIKYLENRIIGKFQLNELSSWGSMPTFQKIIKNIYDIFSYFNIINHMKQISIPQIERSLERNKDNNRTNAEYIFGKLTIATWKKLLFKNEFERIANNETLQILRAFVEVGGDIYRNYTDKCNEAYMSLPEKIRPDSNRIHYASRFSPKLVSMYRELYTLLHETINNAMYTLIMQMDSMTDIYNKKVTELGNTYKINREMIYREDNIIVIESLF